MDSSTLATNLSYCNYLGAHTMLKSSVIGIDFAKNIIQILQPQTSIISTSQSPHST